MSVKNPLWKKLKNKTFIYTEQKIKIIFKLSLINNIKHISL